MKVQLAELAATLALAVGTGAQQNGAQSNASPCLSRPTTAVVCDSATTERAMVQDLTPTQWLFGRDVFKKLTETPMPVLLESQAKAQWTTAVDRAARLAPQPARGTRVNRQDNGKATPRLESTDARRFLVEEWRRTELNVADSVHHANIERIATTYDSVGGINVPDSMRVAVLRRLDRLNQANDYTWVMFRAEVIRRADSAIAGLRAGLPE